MSTKKYFEIFSQSWPKGGAARPVRGERGIHDLPSGEEGGENMELESHYRHKQHTFDVFCKRTIKHEAANAFRQIGWLCIFFFRGNMGSTGSRTFLPCTQNGEAPLCRLLWAEISERLSSSVPLLFAVVNLKRSSSCSLSVK